MKKNLLLLLALVALLFASCDSDTPFEEDKKDDIENPDDKDKDQDEDDPEECEGEFDA